MAMATNPSPQSRPKTSGTRITVTIPPYDYDVVRRLAKAKKVSASWNRVDNLTMGLVFEDLIRRFNEAANETAGDHFTPREVIRLMVNLLLEPDEHILTSEMAPEVGFEPTTNRLTADRSTTELLRNRGKGVKESGKRFRCQGASGEKLHWISRKAGVD